MAAIQTSFSGSGALSREGIASDVRIRERRFSIKMEIARENDPSRRESLNPKFLRFLRAPVYSRFFNILSTSRLPWSTARIWRGLPAR
jgi:hypothetical protein